MILRISGLFSKYGPDSSLCFRKVGRKKISIKKSNISRLTFAAEVLTISFETFTTNWDKYNVHSITDIQSLLTLENLTPSNLKVFSHHRI